MSKAKASTDYLIEVFTEGQHFFKKGVLGMSPSKTHELLTGNIGRGRAKGQNTHRYALRAYLAHHQSDVNALLDYSGLILGSGAIKGMSLDESIVKPFLTGKNDCEIVQVLCQGKSLNEIGVSGAKKQFIEGRIKSIYRASALDFKALQKVLIDDLKSCVSPFSPMFILQYLLMISRERAKDIIKLNKTLGIYELMAIKLYLKSRQSVRKKIEHSLLYLIQDIENFRYCHNASIANLIWIASGTKPTVKSSVRVFDAPEKYSFPSLNEVANIYNLIQPLFSKSTQELTRCFREVAGKDSRQGMYQFCLADTLIKEKGMKVSEAHEELHPEITKSVFYRLYKRWLKSSVNQYWCKH